MLDTQKSDIQQILEKARSSYPYIAAWFSLPTSTLLRRRLSLRLLISGLLAKLTLIKSNVVALSTDLPAKRVQQNELVDQSSVLAPIELPKQPRLPLGLRVLHRFQQGSTVLTGLLVTSALVVYGSSVYLDRSTNQAMAQLNALQSESQQLSTANESIKQSLAEQAVKEDSGLQPYQPDDMLFIKPEPRRADVAQTEESESERLQPLGY